MIPKGLPGEGNIMVYDNGGWAGYGAPNQFSKTGLKVTRRDSSRVVEFNPTNLELVWLGRRLQLQRQLLLQPADLQRAAPAQR